MDKPRCPKCLKELETIDLGCAPYLEWDNCLGGYLYCTPGGDRDGSCPECCSSLPKELMNAALETALL